MPCHISEVVVRHRQAVALLRDAEANYFDPDRFLMYLQSAIQAVRSITFLLQNQKRSIERFDQWYDLKRAEMSSIELLKWIVEARNKVEKQENLAPGSFCGFEISYSLSDKVVFEGPMPMQLTSKQIFDSMKDKVPRGDEGVVFKIVRKWKIDGCPVDESIHAISIAINYFSGLIKNIHNDLNLSCGKSCGDIKGVELYEADGDLFESIFGVEQNGEINFERLEFGFDAEFAMAAKEKYKPKLMPKQEESFSECVDRFFELACQVIKKDGHHIPTMVLFTADRKSHISQLRYNTEEEKIAIFNEIYKAVKKENAIRLLHVNEAWTGTIEDYIHNGRPLRSPRRGEAIVVIGLDGGGESAYRKMAFEKHMGFVIPKEITSHETIPKFYDKIFKALKNNKRA